MDKINAYDKLSSVEYTYLEKKHKALETIAKMLINRNVVDTSVENIYDNFKKSLDTNNDEIATYNYNSISYKVKFIQRQVQTIKKTPEIEVFLEEHAKHYKFLIVSGINEKVKKFLSSVINLEIFTLSEIIINVIDHYLVPKHKLLTSTEKDKLIKEYELKNKDLPRIYISDIISRYYNAQIGDIFEIERYSPISGYSTFYRLVVPGIIS